MSQVPARHAVSSGFECATLIQGWLLSVPTYFPCLPTGSAPPDSRYCVGLMVNVMGQSIRGYAAIESVLVVGVVVCRVEIAPSNVF